MKKKLILGIAILSMIGMILPTASAGFTSYIFKEEFNKNLDNSTWVNTSTPFPYEMKNGQLVLKTYQDPEWKYMRSKDYDISGIDHFRTETKITFDMDKIQNSSSYTSFRLFYFLGKNEGTGSAVWNNTVITFDAQWGSIFDVSIEIGGSSVYKTYQAGNPISEHFYGNETTFYVVGEYYRHLNETNKTDYWTTQVIIENETRVPILVNLDRLTNVKDIFSVQILDRHYSSHPPANGEVRIDYIYAGEYEPEGKPQMPAIFPMFLTFAMAFMLVGSVGTLVDTLGKYEELWYYIMLLGITLLGISFLMLPENILGIPAYLYSIPAFLLVIEELYSTREHGLF